MDLDAAIGHPDGGQDRIGADRVLQPPQVRVDWLVSAVVDIFVRDVAQPDLEFTHFSRERRHQGVLDEPGVDVAAAHLPVESWHLLPQSRTRVRQKEVDVAVDAEC